MHTPKLTKEVHEYLSNIYDDKEVINTSYGNDMTDSITIADLQIFLPNSFINDVGNEQFDFFSVKKGEDCPILDSATFDEVLTFLEYYFQPKQVLASKVVEWYFYNDMEKREFGNEMIKRLMDKGTIVFDVQELYNQLKCIPEDILKGYKGDYQTEKEYDTSEVKLINDYKTK